MLGVSFHVGSQCMDPHAFRNAMDMVNRAIVEAGVLVDIVDVGGGFPAIYPGMTPPPMIDYINAIKARFDDMFVAQNAKLWAEPGRALVAEAGSIVARVELRKDDALYLNDGAFGNLFDATHLNWSFPAKLVRAESLAREKMRRSASTAPPATAWTPPPAPSCCRPTSRRRSHRDRPARRLWLGDGDDVQRFPTERHADRPRQPRRYDVRPRASAGHRGARGRQRNADQA